MKKILGLLTPSFVENLEGLIGDLIRFVWPSKADTLIEKVGSVLALALAALAAFA